MLFKVRQTSGNLSVYEAAPVWEGAQAIKCYGTLVASRFENGWREKSSNWDIPSTPEQVAQYDALPITE